MKKEGGTRILLGSVLKRVYAGMGIVADGAAQVAYYLVFSLFPLLFFLTTLAAYLPIGKAFDAAMDRLRPFLPGQAQAILYSRLHALVTETRPRLLTVGILVAIWSGSRGAAAIGTGLNRAYGVEERRPYWRVQIAAIGVTVVGAMLGLFAIAALVAGSSAGFWLAERIGIGTIYRDAVRWARWPVTAVVVMLAADVAYYFLPDVKQRFRHLAPGALTATGAWMLATWGFGLYVAHFSSYSATYGSIGGAIILLTWFYISAAILLLGGRINAAWAEAQGQLSQAGGLPTQGRTCPQGRDETSPAGGRAAKDEHAPQ
jgi:membrane protein